MNDTTREALAAELLDRIERALDRHISGGAPRRIPVDFTDSDIVLTDLKKARAALGDVPAVPAHDHNCSTHYHARAKCDCSLVATPAAVPVQPECYHDDTQRLGAIWTECLQCGKRWADDAATPAAVPVQPEFSRDDDGELLIDWSPAQGRMIALSLRDDGRLSYAVTWDGVKAHGTEQMPAPSPAAVPLTAPWPDFNGAPIRAGDVIEHPSGERGTVVFLPDAQEPGDQWRVAYSTGAGHLSRLCLREAIDRARAILASPPPQPAPGEVRMLTGDEMQSAWPASGATESDWADIIQRKFIEVNGLDRARTLASASDAAQTDKEQK